MASDTVLIVTIVKKGWGDKVMEASMNAGAEGGTVLFGRGIGIHEHKKIMGIPIEPEKEILFSITPVEKVDAVLEGIGKAADLDKPGAGLAFVVSLEKLIGVVHLLQEEGHSHSSSF